jgi:hypothetical protein
MRVGGFFVSVFILLLCGCQHTGDFGGVFAQAVARYGGHAQTTNAVPELRGTWSLKCDSDGFQAHLSGVPFVDVQKFMYQVYGNPDLVTNDGHGRSFGLYKAMDIGVAIQFFDETNGVGFICLHAQKWPF